MAPACGPASRLHPTQHMRPAATPTAFGTNARELLRAADGKHVCGLFGGGFAHLPVFAAVCKEVVQRRRGQTLPQSRRCISSCRVGRRCFTARRHVVSLFGGRCPLLKMVWMCVHDAWRSRTGPTTHASRSSHSDLSQAIQGYGYRIRIRNTELRPKYGIRIRNTDTEYGSALKIQIRIRNTNTEYGSAPKI